MSMNTKGPWIAKNATLPGSTITRWVILEQQNGFVLACTGNADTPKYQDEANAHLIAAAPELLELLKDVVSYVDVGPKFRAECEAIIKKAEGIIDTKEK